MVNELLRECMKKGFLLDREMLEMFNSLDEDKAREMINVLSGLGLKERVITRKVFENNFTLIRSRIMNFGGKEWLVEFLHEFMDSNVGVKREKIEEYEEDVKRGGGGAKIKLINPPIYSKKKITVKDFVRHFRYRYEVIKGILEQYDFDDLTSVRKIGEGKGKYTIIASVLERRVTKNKNLLLKVEDLTGTIDVLVNLNKVEVFQKASGLLDDDIVAFRGNGSKDFFFCNDIIFPEASIKEEKRHNEDVWVAFISDLHCGSSYFLEKNFQRFIKWINGEEGDEKNQLIALKVRYLFIAGDNIDGINHYLSHKSELDIMSILDQYSKVEELMKLIRSDVEIIMCSGEHDSVWEGEPQTFPGENWTRGLRNISNLHLVSNPANVEIEGGFKFLMYHGSSINAFIDEMPNIRIKYGHNFPSVVVKEMVKRRHLSPMHGLVDYIPTNIDYMLIDPVPDVIVTGNQHRCEIGKKNNILLVATSCWQSSLPYLEKMGLNPDPCKVPLFNLKTREIKILDFSNVEKEIEWDEGENLICKLGDGIENGK